MRPSSLKVTSAGGRAVLAASAAPGAPSRWRNRVAAGLLIASAIVPPLGTFSAMNGLHWGVGEAHFLMVWSTLQWAATPFGNLLSLLVAAPRRGWVKLNYVVLFLWASISALVWYVARYAVITP